MNIKTHYLLYGLPKEHRGILYAIKQRIGTRYYPTRIVLDLIKLGLVAGDYGRLYVTDKGDDVLCQKTT